MVSSMSKAAIYAAMLGAGLGAAPVWADGVLGRASGNWAGTSGQGFHFDATLARKDGQVELWIWQTMTPDVAGSIPDLINHNIVTPMPEGVSGTQTLEAIEGPESAVLNIVTEFSDATGVTHEVVQAQFQDFQFTVTGYSVSYLAHEADGTGAYSCILDLQANTREVDGVKDTLPQRSFEDDNLYYWRPNAAFDRELCPAPDIP